MKREHSEAIAKLVLCVCMTAVLGACGGGGGSSSPPATAASGGVSNATPTSMSGTVAIGHALTGAALTVTDATGKTASATSDANGAYSVSIVGMSAPFLISGTDASGVSSALYSIAPTLPTGTTAPVIANVTPLTTAVTALLTQSGNPLDLTKAGALSSVNRASVDASVAKLNAALAPILVANGLTAASFDPLGGMFTPNQTGADAVIDSVAVTASATGGGMQLASLANPNAAIQLNQSTVVSTALQAPSQPANYLATLVAQLGQCVSGTSSACSTSIDAGYLNSGLATMQLRHPVLFAPGATLTGVKTVAFLPANTLPNISNSAALVYFLFTDSKGVPNFASDIVQQLPNGSWDVIGNQEQMYLYIASFLGRAQFTDAANANNARYESGLRIVVPSQVTVSGANRQVGSASVQGAGLPSNGLYLLNTIQSPDLTIPTTALTAPWTGCSTCSQSNSVTMQYKWSWASLTGATSSFTPSTADYTAQPVDVSAIPQYSVYTVTLYDMSGAQIGQPQRVINVAANVNAAAGTAVAWQTLGSDVISNFLTPGGSQAGVVTSLNLDGTVPANSPSYPNIWTSIGVVQAATQFGPQEAYSNSSAVIPTLAGNGSYSETFTVLPNVTREALSAEISRQVLVGWQADGVFYINTWQYGS
ncbi:cell wall anchor protein [Caballeronia sp. SBC2]|uniref:cell wall anchor protein n=1 Tax=Caballeronia sp. SBC2 TaxID=2705547 RepID=UPI0013E0F40A|nr:cell wall anchor protein [Caballeronia sp. SBC2]QIE29790.1 hypothetical protein SBC2_78660 [Caballeronia sp. SBC2]